MEIQQVIELLKKGKIGVIPTDTIYGIVGSALNPQTVAEIYRLRKRALDKPMIILVSQLTDLKIFNIKLTKKQTEFLKNIWPNPVSVVFPLHEEKFKYLHRGTNSLAFRIPKDKKLLKILKETGPLVAPSANFAGDQPSETIAEAKSYFNQDVSFYVDRGKITSKPSTVIQLNADGEIMVLIRDGSFKISSI